MPSDTESSSDDAVQRSPVKGLYLNNDDSATTLNDGDIDTSNSPTKPPTTTRIRSHDIAGWEGCSRQHRLETLLVAWVLFLRRSSLSEEALSFSYRYATNQKDEGGIQADIASIVPPRDISVAKVRDRVKHLLDDSFDGINSQENPVLLTASASGTQQSQPIMTLEITVDDELIQVRCLKTHSEISKDMVDLQVDVFADIIRTILKSPQQSIENASAVQDRELTQIWQWGGQLPLTLDRGMHEDFMTMAKATPEKPAVVSWDGRLSYGELDILSTNLAVYLISQGIGPGKNVPFCFEKSAWTVVAVLAVMKAGATFVLTDPSQPESRLRTIAEEVNAEIVLTSIMHADLGGRIASTAKVVSIGPDFLNTLKPSLQSELKPVPGDTVMYIIFTSGSTGKPKGVMLTHANYTSGAIPRADAVGYRSHTRVLDFASYAFDVSIDCMICTLATAGCICVPSNDQRMNDLSGAIRDMQVNMVHTTPSVARVLDADIIPSLEVLGLGGEALSARDAEKWNAQTRVINAYGPSECTVGCAINNDIAAGRSYVSLGKGVGSILWIVDPENHDRLSAAGAVGELLVEGPIVGLGYINEPEKTSAAYIDAPSWLMRGSKNIPGRSGRLYKTGDLVKYDPDGSGCVVFVGRKDQQVKIRGQRVELGEVEHHLSSILPPKTAVAAEVIKPGGTGEPTLVAFIAESSIEGSPVDGKLEFSTELQDTLSNIEQTLAVDTPAYMIPSAYIPLAELPIMVSGKTDRKQLRAKGAEMSRQQLAKLRTSSRQRRPPSTNNEQVLAQLWSDLLIDVESPGLDDSFFAIGGDSLRAMKLVAAARAKGLHLIVADIFASPTLAAMAARAKLSDSTQVQPIAAFSLLKEGWTAEGARKEAASLCQVAEEEIEDVLPCTPLQEILMAYSAKVDEAYVAQRVLRLEDQTVAQNFRTALRQTIKECPILRTRIIHLPGHGLVQVVLSEITLDESSTKLGSYIQNDQDAVMTLGSELARFAFVEDEESTLHFVFSIHHALYDGWSMPLIVDRLNRTYQGLETSRSASFPAYIKYLQDADVESSRQYWQGQLVDVSPTQFPLRALSGFQPRPDTLLEHRVELKPLTSATSTTAATLVRAAWAIASAEASGSKDVVFGETLTGRNAPIVGVEEIEGPMITTVPVRITFSKDLTTSDFLKAIQDQTVTRIPHEHFGLQNIRNINDDGRSVYENMFAGLVLHPYAEAKVDQDPAKRPADSLMPVSDTDAAREALKFNSYAVMLVCSLDPTGVLIMASFDSSVVTKSEMQHMLERVDVIMQNMNQSTDRDLRSIMKDSEVIRNGCTQPGSGMSAVPSSPEHRTYERNPTLASDALPDTTTSIEQRHNVLKSCWSRLLSVEEAELGPNDSFFDFGGDSIAAMKLASELRQSGYLLSVAQIFSERALGNMARTMKEQAIPQLTRNLVKSVSDNQRWQLDLPRQDIDSQLEDSTWEIENVLPTRPLQAVAVRGTTRLPRFSARYELLKFDETVDKQKLLESCQTLVDQIEILRTVFVEVREQCLGVVLRRASVSMTEFETDGNVDELAHALCEVDIQSKMPLGSLFVKFMFLEGSRGQSCLILRISHAQYDEICLPIMLRRLSALYENRELEQARPFSGWVHHIVNESIPTSKAYWRDLLQGSKMTVLAPNMKLHSKRPIAVEKTVDISQRPKKFTAATFPTAAWALCLARRFHIPDVVFGEVASGRNTGYDGADQVVGPCWQYIPFRAKFEQGWTAADLLEAVQNQHLASGQYESVGLPEIVEHCTDWPRSIDWFDSVVHQDVAHVEELPFSSVSSRLETVYPHLEPLREWKIQAFHHGDRMTLEIVTFESWKEYAEPLLEDLVAAFEELLQCSDKVISL